MKTRKMWAADDWPERRFFTADSDRYMHSRPVLVTDATDMPDFEPGDRVETACGSICRVVDQPVRICGIWYVPIVMERDSDVVTPMLRSPAALTKLPRETSVLLRVTFAGHPDPDGFVSNLKTCEGVRVERVEDDDE